MVNQKRICVLGAGNMGAGIAQRCAQSGFEVGLRDVSDAAVQAGLSRIRTPLEARVAKGKMKKEEVDAILSKIHATTDLAAAARDAWLVIEAVFEEMSVKAPLFKELNAVCQSETIFASNTSSLSISELAEASGRPERFGGLHFFYPAPVNKLIEVVPGGKTAPEVTERLLDLARALEKVPILVKDRPGFAVNRFFVPYLNEACRILDEGAADIPTMEAAGKEAFNSPQGPFELMNLTGVPIGYHSQCTLHRGLGKAYEPAASLKRQFEAGKKWDFAGAPDATKVAAVRDRFRALAFTIACDLVEEGVAAPEDADKGAVLGLAWKTGPFAIMNEVGTGESLRITEGFATASKGLWKVPANLRRTGADNAPWRLRTVRVDVVGPVATIRIDRPESLNALNSRVLSDLDDALSEIEGNGAVRAVIVTGEGRAFVAGADIREMLPKTPIEGREFTLRGQRVFSRIESLPKAVIAAVNGFALGGGLELALACDFIIASEAAVLGLPEVTLGIMPGFGGTQRLPRKVGPAAAKELVFTGDQVKARDAERIGLVNRVVAPDRLMEEARSVAKKIASRGPLAVAMAKAATGRATETDLQTGLEYEAGLISLLFSTEDKAEGMKAFVEKRQAQFRGK